MGRKELPFSRKGAKEWARKTVLDWYECPLSPITNDFKLDEAEVRNHVDSYVEMGERGLVLGGFISEAWNMTLSDWKRYHEVYAEANNGRLPLWSIILDPSVHQAIEKMRFIQELGYVGAEVINPVVQLRTDDEIFDYFKYMTDNIDLAIILYRTAVGGKLISPELIQRLAELDTIVGVKQGSGNHGDSIKMRKVIRPDFIVSDPIEDYWLDDLYNGGQVLWAAFYHIVYGKKRHILEEYTKLAREGKLEEAHKKYVSLQPARDLLNELFFDPLFKTSSYSTPLANIKVWYEAIGLKTGPVIPPIREVPENRKEFIRAKLKDVGVI